MNESTLSLKERGRIILVNILLFSVLSIFILSPLRLNTDIMRLFAMALPAAAGGDYGIDQFPPFYPHLLCALIKMGWCNSVTLLLINFTALLTSLLFFYKILQINGCTFIETMLSLLSVQLCWCISKHILLPQTDILLLPFFLGSLLAVMRAERAKKLSQKALWLMLAALAAVIALTIRTAAIPLFGVIAVVATGMKPENISVTLRKKSFWLTAFITISVIIMGVILAIKYTEFAANGSYFQHFKSFISRGSAAEFASFQWAHLREIMSLSLNVSAARIPAVISIVGSLLMPLVLLAALIHGLKWTDWCLLLALIGYGIEIFLWPYSDARFFLPVYPIAAMTLIHFLSDLSRGSRFIRGIILCYLIGFLFLGIISWGHLARQWSFGRDFYRHTSSPQLSKDYQNAYHLKIEEIPEAERTFGVYLLKKFDPLHTGDERDKI